MEEHGLEFRRIGSTRLGQEEDERNDIQCAYIVSAFQWYPGQFDIDEIKIE